MARGKFITLEGGEGAGKSTNLEYVRKCLAERGHEVLVTREPGGTPLAEEIRALVTAPRSEPVDAVAETLLIFAARAQHVATVIAPALTAGRWVLCDRFTDSTFAYQGGGRGVDEELLEQLAERVHGHCWPDLTIYLDAPVDAALKRIAHRASDRFESEQEAFFERVRRVFRGRARTHRRIVEVDADQPVAKVRERLAALLAEQLP